MESSEAENSFMVVTFEVQDALMGIDATHIEEIVRVPAITLVPGAESHVRGIVNLRGRIVTVLDVSERLGLGTTVPGPESRILITTLRGESVGVLVPKLADVVETRQQDLKRLSSASQGQHGDNFIGVFEKENRLTMILDPEKTLAAT